MTNGGCQQYHPEKTEAAVDDLLRRFNDTIVPTDGDDSVPDSPFMPPSEEQASDSLSEGENGKTEMVSVVLGEPGVQQEETDGEKECRITNLRLDLRYIT